MGLLPPLPVPPGASPEERQRIARADLRGRRDDVLFGLVVLPIAGVLIAAALLLVLLAGCASPAIDRADARLEERIAQAAAESRQIAQDAVRRVDDATAARVADVAARLATERAATLAEVDARLTAQRQAAAADVATLLGDLDERLDRQRAAAAAELRALVEESLPRAVGSAADAVATRLTRAPPAAPGGAPGPASDDLTALLVTGASSVVATLLLRWIDHRRKAARARTPA